MHQSIQNPVGITVFGSSLVRAEADLALVRLTVSRIESDPRSVLASVRTATNQVRATLRQSGVPEANVQLSKTRLRTAYENHHNRHPIGYEGAVQIRVLFSDLARFDDILVALVEAGAHQVDGVDHMTSRLKPLREQARRQAVESARKKAELYAEATGVKLGHLLHLEDINPESFKERFHAPDVDLTAHDEAADPQNLQPGSVTVAGAVAVVYAILRG